MNWTATCKLFCSPQAYQSFDPQYWQWFISVHLWYILISYLVKCVGSVHFSGISYELGWDSFLHVFSAFCTAWLNMGPKMWFPVRQDPNVERVRKEIGAVLTKEKRVHRVHETREAMNYQWSSILQGNELSINYQWSIYEVYMNYQWTINEVYMNYQRTWTFCPEPGGFTSSVLILKCWGLHSPPCPMYCRPCPGVIAMASHYPNTTCTAWKENHRKTIGKWWLNGIFMGFTLWVSP